MHVQQLSKTGTRKSEIYKQVRLGLNSFQKHSLDKFTTINDFANSFNHSFIHSGYFYSASLSPLYRRSRHSTDTVPEFHAEAPQATVNEELAQGRYVATIERESNP